MENLPAGLAGCPIIVGGGLAGLIAGADQIGQPAEPVPNREPFRAGAGRKPSRRGIAHQFPGEFDFARQPRKLFRTLCGGRRGAGRLQFAWRRGRDSGYFYRDGDDPIVA